MGKKNEKIEQLEGDLTAIRAELAELEATRYLARRMADSVGLEIDTVKNLADANGLYKRFVACMGTSSAARSGRAVPTPPVDPASAGGPWHTFDGEVDETIDRMEAEGLLTKPRTSTALSRDVSAAGAEVDTSDRASEVVSALARELGVGGADALDRLEACYQEVLRLKNAGSDVIAESTNKALSKGDTLAQVMDHAHIQNAELRDGASKARMIVQRVAGAMQIDRYDSDGTELLERIQFFEGVKHWVKQRIRTLSVAPAELHQTIGGIAARQGVLEELETLLARLMSPRECTDWAKARPKGITSPAESLVPMIPPYPFVFGPPDVLLITESIAAVSGRGALRYAQLRDIFSLIGDGNVPTEEFCRLMNVVILPILARQVAARQDATRRAAGPDAGPDVKIS